MSNDFAEPSATMKFLNKPSGKTAVRFLAMHVQASLNAVQMKGRPELNARVPSRASLVNPLRVMAAHVQRSVQAVQMKPNAAIKTQRSVPPAFKKFGPPAAKLPFIGAPNVRIAGTRSNTAQRVVANGDINQSSFDPTKIINDKQAVITAGSSDTWDGGHAVLYLEILDHDDLVKTYLIDLRVGDSIVITVKPIQTEQKGWLWGRSFDRELEQRPRSQSYLIRRDQGFAAMAKADAISKMPDLQYMKTGSKAWNLNYFSNVTYMNCADFAEQVLAAAGVSVSGGPASLPSWVAAPDLRSNSEIYADAAKKM